MAQKKQPKVTKALSNFYATIIDTMTKFRQSAPDVYGEFEKVINQNMVVPQTKKQSSSVQEVAQLVTNHLLDRFQHLDKHEIEQIVQGKNSQDLLNYVANNLAFAPKKEYTILSKKRKFKKVLIANRGEIALRILRACRELQIKTVIIYSNHDKDTLAARYADKAYPIGDATGYLDIKKIVAIAKKEKVDAMHPGYGYLSENAEFAKACQKNDIKFIGPSAAVIKKMADKVQAKKLAASLAIPIIPGSPILKKTKDIEAYAKKIGTPLIIKAASGGGGKGMRIVLQKEKLHDAIVSAQNEAKHSFGDNSIYLEKYIAHPRHIEVQILADNHGNVIHLGERECSIQRKHQKLIEETPSSAVHEALRRRLGKAAVSLAKHCKYEGVGTVEFLLDEHHNFFFIEMNTRIQVEHGITEQVTGIDLVKEQIKVAANAKLALTQDQVTLTGHAIEVRINAENPLEQFAPSIGTVLNYIPPGGPGIRLNSVCHTGCKVLPHYDSLLGLLICHAPTRSEAIARMDRALSEYIIDGIQTTIPFARAVLHNKAFKQGTISTHFIETALSDANILEFVKQPEPLSQEHKTIIINTAVAYYQAKKSRQTYKQTPWMIAARHNALRDHEDNV